MTKFRIREFSIKKFNSKRYLGINLTKIDKHLLIYGEHKSGKSTTLDAISYAIFGINGSGRPINNIAETHIKLSNDNLDLILTRNAGSNHKLTIKNHIDHTTETVTDMDEINNNLTELFKLPSEDYLEFNAKLLYQEQESSLKKFDNKKLLRIISYYTGLGAINKKIECIHDEIKIKIEENEYATIKLKEFKNELIEKRNIINSSKGHIEHLKQLVSSYEDRSMEQVFDIKMKKSELWKKISEIQARNIHLQHEKDKSFLLKNDFKKFYDESLVNLIKEVVSVLICPVCGKRTNLSKIEYKYHHKKCPYCGDEHYDKDLYDNIAQKIKNSEDRLPKINTEIKQIKDELTKNYKVLNDLEKKRDDLKLILNPEIVRCIDKYKYFDDDGLEIFIEEQKAKLDEQIVDFEKTKDEMKVVNNSINEQNKHIGHISKHIETLEKNKNELQKELEEESITKFLQKMNYYYGKLMGYKKQPIVLKDGKLFFKTPLRGKKEEVDDISRSKSIGESEKKCLDAALLFTLIDLDIENNISLINFVILDDPADGLFDDKNLKSEAHNKTNLLNLIKQKCDTNQTQFIILTADKTYNEILGFPTTNINFNTDIFMY